MGLNRNWKGLGRKLFCYESEFDTSECAWKKHIRKTRQKVFSAVSVYHDDYGLFGIVDCLEGSPSANGVKLIGEEERYHLCIVEYKPTKPKNKLYYHEDMMQVFAQKICVDYVFHCDCDAVLYYADVRQRINCLYVKTIRYMSRN